jgi:membrane protein insertase Oxa1/YidC/SpoIIIJ
MTLLGIFDLTKTSVLLAIIAAATQFAHLSISMPDVKISDFKKKGGNMKEDMMNSFQVNIKYGLPILILIMLLTAFNAAVALYWITSNIFMAAQEFVVRGKKLELKDITLEAKNKTK